MTDTIIATAHRDDFLNLGAGLSVYDNEEWRVAATAGLTRFLEPFTVAGYVVMAAPFVILSDRQGSRTQAQHPRSLAVAQNDTITAARHSARG